MTVPPDAVPTRPYFARTSTDATRYELLDPSSAGRAWGRPPLSATAHYRFEGVDGSVSADMLRRVAQFPRGYAMQPVDIAAPVSLRVTPAVRVLRPSGTRSFDVDVEVTSRSRSGGVVALALSSGWTSAPAQIVLPAGEPGTCLAHFRVTPAPLSGGRWRVGVRATVDGTTYDSTYQRIHHEGLPDCTLVSEAAAIVVAVDVQVPTPVRVGYVMGIGDEVPAALAQLGAEVTLLDTAALASGDLARFDTIITGTRAYAVRADLGHNNRRLLDWVRAGGNMVVLYNTPEFDPNEFAPYPATLPPDPEEVCEERAMVTILAPDHPLLTTPNRIGPADFEGWVEQRGSKFLAAWDAAYVPLVESHDRGQAPQRGGWVTARYGRGRWTYMAYALHRQLPAGVQGAYRLLANLIAGREGMPQSPP